ncbi:MAG: hypothetical protein ACK4YX_04010 [Rhabdaerophilum calidifontis]
MVRRAIAGRGRLGVPLLVRDHAPDPDMADRFVACAMPLSQRWS